MKNPQIPDTGLSLKGHDAGGVADTVFNDDPNTAIVAPHPPVTLRISLRTKLFTDQFANPRNTTAMPLQHSGEINQVRPSLNEQL